jgi:hypothetical protein
MASGPGVMETTSACASAPTAACATTNPGFTCAERALEIPGAEPGVLRFFKN